MPDHRRRPDSAAKKKRAAETTDPHPNPDDPTPASLAARATESISRKSSRKAPPAVTEDIATDRRNPGASDGPRSRRKPQPKKVLTLPVTRTTTVLVLQTPPIRKTNPVSDATTQDAPLFMIVGPFLVRNLSRSEPAWCVFSGVMFSWVISREKFIPRNIS